MTSVPPILPIEIPSVKSSRERERERESKHRAGISKDVDHTYRKWTLGHTSHCVMICFTFRTVSHAIFSPHHLTESDRDRETEKACTALGSHK